MRKFMSRKVVQWTCSRANELIAVSDYQLVQLSKYGIRRAAKVIPWGVDAKLFFPTDKEPVLPLKFIHVANLTAVKDQVTLVKVFANIRKAIPSKLRMVGPDFFNGVIQRLVDELGLTEDVEFTGFVLNRDILKHYHWADAFVLTSLSEGQNNSITEAMMCGLLPVSTRVGIMHDLGNTVGVVEDVGDHEALARSVIELYNQSQEWKSRCMRARVWAMTHDLEWTTDQLQHVIENATICKR
jgi:glycosyltransferase involved in cell wall biosynthesis